MTIKQNLSQIFLSVPPKQNKQKHKQNIDRKNFFSKKEMCTSMSKN